MFRGMKKDRRGIFVFDELVLIFPRDFSPSGYVGVRACKTEASHDIWGRDILLINNNPHLLFSSGSTRSLVYINNLRCFIFKMLLEISKLQRIFYHSGALQNTAIVKRSVCSAKFHKVCTESQFTAIQNEFAMKWVHEWQTMGGKAWGKDFT